MTNNASLDPLFFRRLWKLFGILFQRFNSRSALIFYTLTFLALAAQFVIYAAGLVPSKYFEVLGAKNYGSFTKLAIYSILLIVFNAVIKSSQTYISRVLYLTWRKILCTHLHNKYFDKLNYYKLNVIENSLDNIDQRVTRDVDQFTREWSILISRLVVIPFTIGYYSYQCFMSTTWLGPVTIYIYFIVGTIINRLIMAPIVRLNVEQEVCEGNFRFQHLNVRVNAESLAFYRAGQAEHIKSENRLKALLRTQMSLFNWSFWLNSSVNIFDYVGGILSYLVIAGPIFGGTYDDLAPEELSALISRTSFVCIYLIHSFSQLIDMSSTVGDIAAHTHRLGQLLESLKDKMENGRPPREDGHENEAYINDRELLFSGNDSQNAPKNLGTKEVEFEERAKSEKEEFETNDSETQTFFHLTDVSFFTPDHSMKLLESLKLSLSSGRNVLVTGATGCGKTSLLRILAGLWPISSGSIKRFCGFGAKGVVYLPQKPLLTCGTLQDQVIYPRSEPYPEYSINADKDRTLEILEEVGLGSLLENNGGLDGSVELNWNNKLSPGEVQRLMFARLFYHHPDLAVMDEPTSGLNKSAEDSLFESCAKRKITCFTVGHSTNLNKHHDIELKLQGNGSWTFTSLL